MKRVLVLLVDGFEDVEAIGTIDLLRRSGCHVDVCSAENKNEVVGSNLMKIVPDCKVRKVSSFDYDLLFLPGGPGTNKMGSISRVNDLILEFNENNRLIAAICAAPSILGKLGILKNKKYTCFPGYELNITNGIKLESGVVVSGNIVTGAGVGYVLEFALKLIEIMLGEEKALEISENILYNKY